MIEGVMPMVRREVDDDNGRLQQGEEERQRQEDGIFAQRWGRNGCIKWPELFNL